MNDLIAKLKLDNSGWDQSINKARGTIKKFEVDSNKSMVNIDGVTQGLGSTFGKFAGMIGLAVGAGETMNKMMESNQTTSDIFHNNINAARDSVDLFFKALATGDFTSFNNGLIDTFNRLKDVSTAFDELADKKLSLSFISTKTKSELDKYEEVSTNTQNSKEIRLEAANKMFQLADSNAKKIEETSRFQIETIIKQINAQSGMKFNSNELIEFIEKTNFNGEETNKANTAYKKYIELVNKQKSLKNDYIYDAKNFGTDPNRPIQKQYNDISDQTKSFKEQNDLLIKQGWLTEQNDEQRTTIINSLKEQIQLEGEAYALRKRATDAIKSVNDSTKKTTTSTNATTTINNGTVNNTTKVIDKNIITKISDELSIWQKKYNEATTTETQIAAKRMIDEINQKKINIEAEIHYNEINQAKESSINELNNQLTSWRNNFNEATTYEARQVAQTMIDEINSKKAHIEVEITYGKVDNLKPIDPKPINKIPVAGKKPLSGIQNEGIKVTPIGNDVIESNYKYIDSVNAIASVMGSVNGMMGEGASSWINYTATLITSIASALPAISSLVVALGAKAGAEALAQSSSMGPWGWVMGIAAVASVIATIASLPKFENGGIVPGVSVSGDNVLARVNSGEMILNRSQQSNLFNIINNGGINTNNQSMNAKIDFKIAGKDLVGVLNNYNGKIAKY